MNFSNRSTISEFKKVIFLNSSFQKVVSELILKLNIQIKISIYTLQIRLAISKNPNILYYAFHGDSCTHILFDIHLERKLSHSHHKQVDWVSLGFDSPNES